MENAEKSVETAILAAIKAAGGSEAKLGSKIGYSQVAINKAKNKKRCSPRMAVAIELAFGGQFRREQFCPQIFGV